MRKILVLLTVSRILTYGLPFLFAEVADPGFNRWDAPHYLYLAQNWYASTGDPANFIVFPPLYPILVKLTNIVFSDYSVSAILLSNFLFIFGGVVFYSVVSKTYSRKIATLATIFLCIFPTSYFFSAPYTESLFLLLSAGVFYLVRQKKWFVSAVLASLAMLTRHIGLLLAIPIFYEWFGQPLRPLNKKIVQLFTIVIPFLVAIYSYLEINFLTLGDPFAFQAILQNHWQKNFAFPWQSLIASLNNALVWPINDYSMSVGIWEAVPATLSLLLIPSAYKYLKKSWAHYYTAYTIFILSTSFLLSTPRYLLSNIPIFVILAFILEKKKYSLSIWIFLSTALLSYFANLFVNGQWAF